MRSSFAVAILLGMGGCGDDGPSTIADAAGDDDAPVADGVVPVGHVQLNELVAYPLADWSGGGYAGAPGSGTIDGADQWIELTNAGGVAVDVTGWQLEVRGRRGGTTILGTSGALAFSDGSTLAALQPGGFIVIGDPVGEIPTDAWILLRDGAGNEIDAVELGGLTPERDVRGDGIDTGAPGPGANGFARGGFEQAILRPVGAPDTGDDAADFDTGWATPRAANLQPSVPVETVAPAVTASSTGASFRAHDPIIIEFDEPMAAASFDGRVTVLDGATPLALGFHTFVRGDATLVVNPIGTLPYGKTLTVTVDGGSGGVTDLAGNPLATDHVTTVTVEGGSGNPSAVVINELCLDPRQDWSDSAGGALPFDDLPGTGAIDPGDQWLEILVRASGPYDISTFSIAIYAGPNRIGPARIVIPVSGGAIVARKFGADNVLTSVAPGERVVVGNLPYDLPLDLALELRNGVGNRADVFEVGGNAADRDRGGDGTNNGAPDAGANGASTATTDESVARLPDGTDTGSDIGDFAHRSATPGASN